MADGAQMDQAFQRNTESQQAGSQHHDVQGRMLRSKNQVAQSFSHAAPRYDSLARLQRALGDELLRFLENEYATNTDLTTQGLAGVGLDVGSGTGVYSLALAQIESVTQVVSLDIADGMLRYAQQQRHHEAINWLQADAESIPLAEASVDFIFANLSLQWSERPSVLFAELARVLKPGGMLAFNTLGPKTLHELRHAWENVDPFVHVNEFIGLSQLVEAMPTTLVADRFESFDKVLSYSQLGDLLNELKGIGASNHNQGRPAGLGGRSRLNALYNAYEGFRNKNDQLPATYEVICGVFRKNI